MNNKSFSSIFHLNQIQRGDGANLKEYGAHHQELADDHHEGKQQPDTNWLDMEHHPEDVNSLDNMGGGGLYDHQQDPTHNKLVDFLEGSQESTSLPQLINWVQNQNGFQFQQMATVPALYPLVQPIHDQDAEAAKLQFKDHKTHSLELLTNYGNLGFKNNSANHDHQGNLIISNDENSSRGQQLSLAEIIRVAGERYIQFSTQKVDSFSELFHPYAGNSATATDLTVAESADVELVQLLLMAAECVGNSQFELASALIARCLPIASDSGNPSQRIVHYFAEALQNRINIQTGRTAPDRILQQSRYASNLELDFNLSFLACHQSLPFVQVTQFAAVQAIFDNVMSATKIHLIDLHIRSGVQWSLLMQALAEHQDEHRPRLLKISAVGSTNKRHLEETGKRLMSFAQSLNLCLSFNVVMVSDMKELKAHMFNKAPGETVAVYSSLILRTMISKPDCMGNVMRAMRRLKPAVVVVTEVEANHNSPLFVSRFTESLFFYSAFFDCLEECMGRNDEHRKTLEAIHLGEGIRNMVGTEGESRCSRNVMIDVWRDFFGRYGMAEVELSQSSLRQAKMILNSFHKATSSSSCTITNTGKGIVVRWKGTPIHSLTTWKFIIS